MPARSWQKQRGSSISQLSGVGKDLINACLLFLSSSSKLCMFVSGCMGTVTSGLQKQCQKDAQHYKQDILGHKHAHGVHDPNTLNKHIIRFVIIAIRTVT